MTSSSSSSTSQIIESKLIYQTTIQSNDNTIINDYLSPLHPSSPDHQNAPDLHPHRHHHPQLQIISDYLNSSVHHRNVDDNEDSNEGTEFANNTKSGDSSSHQNTINKQSSNHRHHQFNSNKLQTCFGSCSKKPFKIELYVKIVISISLFCISAINSSGRSKFPETE